MIQAFSDYLPASSEIFLFFSTVLLVLIGAIKLDRSYNLLKIFASVTILSTLIILILLPSGTLHTFSGVYVNDYFSYTGKIFILFLMFFLIFIISKVHHFESSKKFEAILLLMFMTLVMLIMLSSLDFIVAFISLEILSLILYILIAINRDEPKAIQSAMMYFIYGSIATAFFIFGISFLYGATGSTHFDNIATDLHTAVVQQKNLTLAVLGLIFILIAFGFKLAIAPLHFWLADIFKGCHFSTILILATLPKFAEMMLLVRILMQALPDLKVYWQPILIVFSMCSFIFGTFGALSQTNLKRFFAYSASANMGFVLLGLLQGSEIGLASAGFYMCLYTITMFGIFALLINIEKKGYSIETFEDLNRIAPNYKSTSFLLGVLIISLAGIPFAPGFFAKVYILYAAIFHEAYSVTIIAILSSVISTAYYLVFIKTLSFNGVASTIKQSSHSSYAFFKMCTITIILCIISILFCLNFWIHVTHKMAIALMH